MFDWEEETRSEAIANDAAAAPPSSAEAPPTLNLESLTTRGAADEASAPAPSASTVDYRDYDEQLLLELSRPRPGIGHPQLAPTLARQAAAPEDDMDIDPQTLQAAAERLARFTTETPVEHLTEHRYADIFRETGPEDDQAFPSEPMADVFRFVFQREGAEGATGTGAARLQLRRVMRPHKVIASAAGAGGRGYQLGLVDDVDCALVHVDPEGGAAHVGWVPALAYVAAGKTRRKFLEVGAAPAAAASAPACLVESHGLLYLYRSVPRGQQAQAGRYQMVELGLPAGSPGVLGAFLAPAGDPGGEAPGMWLVVLLLADSVRCVWARL